MWIRVHLAAFLAGFILDLIFGDPYWLPHPIRAIGWLIARLDQTFIGKKGKEKTELSAESKKIRGFFLVGIVLLVTGSLTALLILAFYRFGMIPGMIVEAIMTYQILATRCLKVESMKVYRCLKKGDLETSRKAVSMIVGRDTDVLDEKGVTRAAVETVAENTSDGSVAPLIYTALGGPILGFLYKAVNTMDSMIGYKNDRYLDFGYAAAKLDDVVNYIPSRIAALCMILACFLAGKEFSAHRAWKIHERDQKNHASPNSAQTESVVAGALGIRLAGDASYFGKIVKKPYIGDPVREVEPEDIPRANRLLYGAAFIVTLLLGLLLFACSIVI